MFCSQCGKENGEVSAFCSQCGSPLSITPATVSEIPSKKIGGWLYVLGLALLISPFMLLYGVYDTVSLITDGTIEYASEIVPGIDHIIWFEVIVDTLFLFISVYLIYLFSTKRQSFPTYYIYYLTTSLIYLIADYMLLASMSTTNEEMLVIMEEILDEQVISISASVIGSIIWVLYLKKSVRVTQTFIK